MHKFGALTPVQIDALLDDPGHRLEALLYLAECTRLMTALAPFVKPARTHIQWVPRPEHVAHEIAAMLKAGACPCKTRNPCKP